MKKQILIITLIVSLALSLAACSGSNATNGTSTPGTPNGAAPSAADNAKGAAAAAAPNSARPSAANNANGQSANNQSMNVSSDVPSATDFSVLSQYIIDAHYGYKDKRYEALSYPYFLINSHDYFDPNTELREHFERAAAIWDDNQYGNVWYSAYVNGDMLTVLVISSGFGSRVDFAYSINISDPEDPDPLIGGKVLQIYDNEGSGKSDNALSDLWNALTNEANSGENKDAIDWELMDDDSNYPLPLASDPIVFLDPRGIPTVQATVITKNTFQILKNRF